MTYIVGGGRRGGGHSICAIMTQYVRKSIYDSPLSCKEIEPQKHFQGYDVLTKMIKENKTFSYMILDLLHKK